MSAPVPDIITLNLDDAALRRIGHQATDNLMLSASYITEFVLLYLRDHPITATEATALSSISADGKIPKDLESLAQPLAVLVASLLAKIQLAPMKGAITLALPSTPNDTPSAPLAPGPTVPQ